MAMSTSLLFFSKESLSLPVLRKICMIQIMARRFLKTSGFRGTVKFDFASSYLRCLVDDFYMQGI